MPTRKNIITILIVLTTIIALITAITIAINISTPPPFSQKTIIVTNESKIAGFTLFETTPFAETPVPWNSTIIYYQNGTVQIININNSSQNWWMPIINESKNRNFNYIQSLGNSTTYIPQNPENSIFTNGKQIYKASTNSKHPTVNTETTYFNNNVILTEIIARNPEQKSNTITITDETKITGFALNENSITNALFLPWYSIILYHPNGTLQIINIDTNLNKPSPELWETIINEAQNGNYDQIQSLGNNTTYIPIPPEDSIFIYGRSNTECPNYSLISHPTPPPFSQKTIIVTNESKIAGFTLFETTPFAETPVPRNSTIIYYQNGTVQIININNPSQNWWMPIINESKNRNFNYIQSLGNSTTYIPQNPENSIFTNGKQIYKASTNSKHPTVNTQTTYLNNNVILTEIIVTNPETQPNTITITDETKITGFALNENSITNALFLPWYSIILYHPNGTLQTINIDTNLNKPSPELWETIINEAQNGNYDQIKTLGNSTTYIPQTSDNTVFSDGRSNVECPNYSLVSHPTPDITTVSFNNETILAEIDILETQPEKQDQT